MDRLIGAVGLNQLQNFSLNALWTLLADKNMDKMLFVKGNVFRATGTTSQHVVDERHAEQYQHSLKVAREGKSASSSSVSLEMVA